jgi:hypothetical protein|nr:MAG TPA: Baseplate structural protein [Caudoviricetes sp.]
MIYEKPKNEIFASDAKDGEIVEFPNVKRGWGVTENLGFIPPMEYFNAAFNRVDKSLAYQLQRGVAEWDKDLEYPIGAVVSLNGVIYIAKSQNINKNPANEATIWDIVATQKWCEDSFMKKTDDKFALKDDLPPLATETKAGITKLKNIINSKQTDTAVTEKAVVDFIQSHTPPSLGVGQTWQEVTNQRRMNETYTNTTGKPIYVQVNINNAANVMFTFKINNIEIEHNEDYRCVMNYIIPPNATYKVYSQNGATNYVYTKWYELR